MNYFLLTHDRKNRNSKHEGFLTTDDADIADTTEEKQFSLQSFASRSFFCNEAQSFGKEWETVCVSGLPRTKTTTMKAIENIVSDVS